jgi:Rieske Fe-S protein
VLACAGAACAAVLAGCSKYNSNNGGVAGSQPAPASSSSAAPASQAGSGSGAAAAPAALAGTSDIPVGGGKILADKKIVITQPQSGAFHAFSAVCTHAGCTVGSVSGGTINCPCHGSRFNIGTGAVVNGPATSPLPPVSIKVQGTSIVQA